MWLDPFYLHIYHVLKMVKLFYGLGIYVATIIKSVLVSYLSYFKRGQIFQSVLTIFKVQKLLGNVSTLMDVIFIDL